ncbi:MAG: ribulose-phosphate 3-epimerase [Chitinophagaceae bacterium]
MSIWHEFPDNRILAELSLWSADLANLAEEINRMDPYADFYHIDTADGHFAPQFLFFPDLVARLRQLTRKPFHVHLMVDSAILLHQIDQFIEAGADIITIWYENGEVVPNALDQIRSANLTAGMSLGLETPPEVIIPYFDRIDLVTMMGTRVGVKGQDLSEQACTRMNAMRQLIWEHGYSGKIKLAADGGNRSHTVPALRAAGADTVVLGSLAYGSQNLKQTFDWLWSLAGPPQEQVNLHT